MKLKVTARVGGGYMHHEDVISAFKEQKKSKVEIKFNPAEIPQYVTKSPYYNK